MPHLIPVFEYGVFVTVHDAEPYSVPYRHYRETDSAPGIEVEVHEPAYWVRLSAPGYLDVTDWKGPFTTLTETREYVANVLEVDPDTGESLIDEE